MKLRIFINSSKRHDNVRTLKQFPAHWADFTRIVVPYDQSKAYENLGWTVQSVPEGVPKRLSSQRQWVMENADCDWVFFMDDDLDFTYRLPETTKLRKADDSIMEAMLIDVMMTMRTFPLVGISTRFGNNHVLADYEEIGRVTRCYCIDRKTFFKVGCSFAPYEPFAMQDFHVTLCFLEHGYPNRILYKYAQGDPGSNTLGGCSDYRTYEVHQNAARWIMTHHPESVKLCAKITKGGWDGFKKIGSDSLRTDVQVYWKKAYRPSGKTARPPGGITSFLKS